ncbi:unnamed protein product [Cylindrotheca closterium]|uniref:DUF6824 domain-containing protein n=1 Tax=Cylindrotheca closterium TaxID=2856 RepID=A0AAD2FZV5_9STRA|nr:unnamed protein product [Cylindrotheca closterium]
MATVTENRPPNAVVEKKEGITSASHHDVLLGRGGGTNNHIGNKNFRKLVNDHKKRYLACSKVDKPKIAREVVEIWQKLDPPGRFLQKISGGDSRSKEPAVYEEVSLKKAREKASQCLRERTSDVVPYLNKYQQDQDKKTEPGVDKGEGKVNGETKGKVPVKTLPSPDQSTSGAVPSETAQAQQKIVQAAQSHQSDLGLQQLYARQQQNLRQAYMSGPDGQQQQRLQQTAMQQTAMQSNGMQPMPQNAMQQNAMHMARQQAFHEQQVLEHQTKMLLQQQMAMQEQLLKNNIMAQQLMLQRNGYAMAAAQQAAAQQGLPPPGTPDAARRMSLNTGFSQLGIKNGGVSPGQHHVVSSSSPVTMHSNSPAVHHGNSPAISHSSPNVVAGQMMVHKMASIPVQPNLTQLIQPPPNMVQRQNLTTPEHQPSASFAPLPEETSNHHDHHDHHPIPLDNNDTQIDHTAILEYSAHLEKQEHQKKTQGGAETEHKEAAPTTNTRKKPKSPVESQIPKMIATNSSDDLDAIKPAVVSSSDMTEKDHHPNGLADHQTDHLHDSGKLSHFSDYDGTLQDYHTRLNDRGSPHVFDDDSSEEMLKDHSALRDHSAIRDDLQSESCDHSLPRKKAGRKTRRTSKSSVMSMSIGSLSGMDYSADELRDHKMHSSRSFGSNRSLMSELTDYQDLIL